MRPPPKKKKKRREKTNSCTGREQFSYKIGKDDLPFPLFQISDCTPSKFHFIGSRSACNLQSCRLQVIQNRWRDKVGVFPFAGNRWGRRQTDREIDLKRYWPLSFSCNLTCPGGKKKKTNKQTNKQTKKTPHNPPGEMCLPLACLPPPRVRPVIRTNCCADLSRWIILN